MPEEYSESGSPIYRYNSDGNGEKKWRVPNMEDSCLEAISDHIETHIGKIDTVWHEIMSDLVHIDVHQVAPTAERPYWTLVTSGMSDLPMTTPAGLEGWRFAELILCLRANWSMGQEAFREDENYWPIFWLKRLARFPHEYKTWFSWGHTIPNGDPADPLDPSVGFTGLMLGRPATVSTDFWTLNIRADKQIHFFALLPLYTNEMDLKLKKGAEEIERLFEKNKITELIDTKRRNLSDSPWWKIW